MLNVKGIRMRGTKAGSATSNSPQLILDSGFIMNKPTKKSMGAVDTTGTDESTGAKNINGKKSKPATTAVIPVRPPSSTPAALLI